MDKSGTHIFGAGTWVAFIALAAYLATFSALCAFAAGSSILARQMRGLQMSLKQAGPSFPRWPQLLSLDLDGGGGVWEASQLI